MTAILGVVRWKENCGSFGLLIRDELVFGLWLFQIHFSIFLSLFLIFSVTSLCLLTWWYAQYAFGANLWLHSFLTEYWLGSLNFQHFPKLSWLNPWKQNYSSLNVHIPKFHQSFQADYSNTFANAWFSKVF